MHVPSRHDDVLTEEDADARTADGVLVWNIGVDGAALAQDATLCARLVAACEERKPSQLALLQPWLEARAAAAEGTADAEVIRAALERIEKAAKAWW